MGCGCVKVQAWWFCKTCNHNVCKTRDKNVQSLLQKHKEGCPGAFLRVKYVHTKNGQPTR